MIRRAAAGAAALFLLLAGAAPALAVPAVTAIDPRCDVYEVGGILTVLDPSETPADLPPEVTIDDMACIINTGTQFMYAYFTDPRGKLAATLTSLQADGWQLLLVADDGSETPFDAADLPGILGDEDLTFRGERGPGTGIAVLYGTELNGDFGAGTFIIAIPNAEPVVSAGDGIDDPSTISNLRTIADAVPTPAQGAVLVISAGLLTLLLAIPAFLLTKVFESRYDQWFGWLNRGRIGRVRKELGEPAGTGRRWLYLAAGMVLASLIAGFVDPRFGFNGLSLRLFLTLLATFALFNVGAWALITLVLRRVQPDARPTLSFHPASLLVVAVAVLLSRLLGFDPGIIFGLVAGTTFAITLARSREALVIIVGSAYAALVAVIAWVAYSAMNAGGPPEDALLVSVSEFLGGVTLEGVSTLPIALIPLATLEGGILFAWRKWVWAVSYVVGLALFMLVLFNLPGGDTPLDGGFVRWVVVFAVFAMLAVGVWLADLLVRRRKPATTAA